MTLSRYLKHMSLVAGLTALGGLILGSCAKKLQVAAPAVEVTPPLQEELSEPPQQEDIEASLRGKDFSEIDELKTVYFDFDSANLKSETQTMLEANTAFLKEHPGIEVRLDGHCDERGTTAYNLGLGQRRAAGVRAYLKSLGITGARMATLSWGEEKPVCQDLAEACHTQNRRVEFKARVKNQPQKKTKQAIDNKVNP